MIKMRLQDVLDGRQITQSQLAQMSGVRRARINEICLDRVERLELSHVNAICNALNVPPWIWIIWTRDDDNSI